MYLKNILINVFVILALLSCTKFDVTLGETNTSTNVPPDMEFFGFKRETYVTNFKQIDIFATNAKFFDKKQIIELFDTRSYSYKEDGTIAASISADLTIIKENNLFTRFYTNVVAKASNDTTLYTEYLEWDNQKRYFKTPEHVRVEQDNGNWLTGSGMEGDLNMEHITIYNEVDEGTEIGVPIEEKAN